MSDLISKKALIKRFSKLKGSDTLANMFVSDVIREIKNQPTVEAVPVVRCKDCKYWHEETGWCQWHSHFIDGAGGFCHPWESSNWKMFNENDFCSDGEMRSSAE